MSITVVVQDKQLLAARLDQVQSVENKRCVLIGSYVLEKNKKETVFVFLSASVR
jgi:hypothetical protein